MELEERIANVEKVLETRTRRDRVDRFIGVEWLVLRISATLAVVLMLLPSLLTKLEEAVLAFKHFLDLLNR